MSRTSDYFLNYTFTIIIQVTTFHFTPINIFCVEVLKVEPSTCACRSQTVHRLMLSSLTEVEVKLMILYKIVSLYRDSPMLKPMHFLVKSSFM